MATLQEVDSNIKEIAAKIKTLKASGTAEPATVNQLVVGQRNGHRPDDLACYTMLGNRYKCTAE